MAVSMDSLMAYVGIEPEYADETQKTHIARALKAAEAWLAGAVGRKVDMDDPRAEAVVEMAAAEIYESRLLTDDRLSKYAGAKVLASVNRMAGDILMQLKYDSSEEGGGEA